MIFVYIGTAALTTYLLFQINWDQKDADFEENSIHQKFQKYLLGIIALFWLIGMFNIVLLAKSGIDGFSNGYLRFFEGSPLFIRLFLISGTCVFIFFFLVSYPKLLREKGKKEGREEAYREIWKKEGQRNS